MDSLRVDKWLWFARLCKSRSLAAAMVEAGQVWLNDRPIRKAAQPVRPGDHIRAPQGNRMMLVEILQLGTRRGPAPEAQSLYRLLSSHIRTQDEDEDGWGIPQPPPS